MKDKPLVSICIITYNSAKFISETLESAKAQTYQNLELIVSDDCSTDNTVQLVKQWMSENKERFVRTELLAVENNTGIPANCNRGNAACRGEWVKGLAGDDVFLPNCIEDDINYVLEHPETELLFTNGIIFYDYDKTPHEHYMDQNTRNFFDASAAEQYDLLLSGQLPKYLAPSFFRKADIIRKYPFDETYKHLEDLPEWLTLTAAGYKLYYCNNITVKWRVHLNNLSKVNRYRYYNPQIFDSMIPFFYLKMRPVMQEKGYTSSIVYTEKTYMLYYFVMYVLKNKRNLFTRVLLRIIRILLKI